MNLEGWGEVFETNEMASAGNYKASCGNVGFRRSFKIHNTPSDGKLRTHLSASVTTVKPGTWLKSSGLFVTISAP
jgi:hypothetical protein